MHKYFISHILEGLILHYYATECYPIAAIFIKIKSQSPFLWSSVLCCGAQVCLFSESCTNVGLSVLESHSFHYLYSLNSPIRNHGLRNRVEINTIPKRGSANHSTSLPCDISTWNVSKTPKRFFGFTKPLVTDQMLFSNWCLIINCLTLLGNIISWCHDDCSV